MPRVGTFDTPGSLRDAPDGSAFYEEWDRLLDAEIRRVTPGDPSGEFVDQTESRLDPVAERSLVWMGFPRKRLVVRHRDDRAAAFAAGEIRTNQDEYLEWHVTRRGDKIRKVVFVTELPEYWERLWETEPDVVLRLYRDLVGPRVRPADLVTGSPPVYNRENEWNTTKGIVHFIQGINTLDAAGDLAQGSVVTAPAVSNYEVPSTFETSADPRVKLDIGVLARMNLSIALSQPVGLYMTHWDDTGWTKPNGRPVGNYWRVVRGVEGAALRLEYEVPKSEGFLVGDIAIGGRPIETGGQIAEHVTVMARGVAGRRMS